MTQRGRGRGETTEPDLCPRFPRVDPDESDCAVLAHPPFRRCLRAKLRSPSKQGEGDPVHNLVADRRLGMVEV